MIKRKNLAGESGSFNPFALAVVVISAVLVAGAAAVLTPAAATHDTSTKSTTTYTGSSGYFPNEFINQAKEIAPMPATF
jgi:hypothetical protein